MQLEQLLNVPNELPLLATLGEAGVQELFDLVTSGDWDGEYPVQEILGERVGPGGLEFRVRWGAPWTPDYDLWVDATTLARGPCQAAVNRYRRGLGKGQGQGARGMPNAYWQKVYHRSWRPHMDGISNVRACRADRPEYVCACVWAG